MKSSKAWETAAKCFHARHLVCKEQSVVRVVAVGVFAVDALTEVVT